MKYVYICGSSYTTEKSPEFSIAYIYPFLMIQELFIGIFKIEFLTVSVITKLKQIFCVWIQG